MLNCRTAMTTSLGGKFHTCDSNVHVDTQLGVGHYWWFNYPGQLLNVEFEFACLS